jgi:outer membrane protein assembly factor BamB
MPNLGHTTALRLLVLLAAVGRADDWPQWRGPNRDGVWRETGILEIFPPDGLKVRWRVPIGWGWSSPVVAHGRVYLTASELMKPKAQEHVLCFDEATGKKLWTHTYPVAYPDWAFDPGQEGRPTATPLVHAGNLYTLGSKGDLCCFEALTGKLFWKRNLEKDYQAQEFAFRASPLVEGDLLILCVGSYPSTSPSFVIALDRISGKEVWKAPSEGLTNSSPIVVTARGKRQVIVWTQGSVMALEPATGKCYWNLPMRTSADSAVSTPVFHANRLLIGGLMLQFDSARPAATVLWPDTKAVTRRILSNTSTALLQGDFVYSAKSPGLLVCLEAGTGKQVWQTDKMTSQKSGASIHLTPNGTAVFLYTDRGELIRAQLTGAGYKEFCRTRLLEPTGHFAGRQVAWPPPAYANRHIFVRSDKELVCASLAAQP